MPGCVALIEVPEYSANLATWWLHGGVTMARRKKDAPIDLERAHEPRSLGSTGDANPTC